jgi:hypothetical protein
MTDRWSLIAFSQQACAPAVQAVLNCPGVSQRCVVRFPSRSSTDSCDRAEPAGLTPAARAPNLAGPSGLESSGAINSFA